MGYLLCLYAHVFSWPANCQLRIPSLNNLINKIYLLNDPTTTLTHLDSNGCTTISVPATAPDAINPVIVVDISGVPSASTQYIKVTGLAVNSSTGSTAITVGDTLPMLATVLPTNAAIQPVTWSVSDTARASVNAAGVLSAKRKGSINAVISFYLPNNRSEPSAHKNKSRQQPAGHDHYNHPIPPVNRYR